MSKPHKDSQAAWNEKKRQERLARNQAAGLNPKTGKPYPIPKVEWQRQHRAKLREARQLQHKDFTVHQAPSEDPTFDEIVADKIKVYDRKKENHDARQLIEVDIHTDGPIGIVFMGDPHLDDPGLAIHELLDDMRVIRTNPGMFAVCVGDMANHWVGRLQKLWARQSTTARESWILIEGFFERLKGRLLAVLGGNHDAWAANDGDLLEWIANAKQTLYSPFYCRVKFNFPNGKSIICNARHDFPGSSIWNKGHGPMRAAQMSGLNDDIYIAGHLHTSAYSPVKSQTGKIMHCLRVAAYKTMDEFAIERGLTDHRMLCVFDSSINTAIHEAVHMARIILTHCGVKYSINNDEPLAYLAGWLGEEMIGLVNSIPREEL